MWKPKTNHDSKTLQGQPSPFLPPHATRGVKILPDLYGCRLSTPRTPSTTTVLSNSNGYVSDCRFWPPVFVQVRSHTTSVWYFCLRLFRDHNCLDSGSLSHQAQSSFVLTSARTDFGCVLCFLFETSLGKTVPLPIFVCLNLPDQINLGRDRSRKDKWRRKNCHSELYVYGRLYVLGKSRTEFV